MQPETAWRGNGETSTFSGFIHLFGLCRGNGASFVWRTAAKKRMIVKLKSVKAELRRPKRGRKTEAGAWLRKVWTRTCLEVPRRRQILCFRESRLPAKWSATLCGISPVCHGCIPCQPDFLSDFLWVKYLSPHRWRYAKYCLPVLFPGPAEAPPMDSDHFNGTEETAAVVGMGLVSARNLAWQAFPAALM